MNDSSTQFPRFSRYIKLIVLACIAFALSFMVYVHTEKQIDRANEIRAQTDQLADELHQSSDDLTRMVRTYVATSNPIYKQRFQDSLAIRDGKKARPLDYGSDYWDSKLENKAPALGPAVPLLTLIQQAGFTAEEQVLLTQAKNGSDKLTNTEWAAIHLLESTQPHNDQNRLRALAMLHDAAYEHAKAEIMAPIHEFHDRSAQRTLIAVRQAEKRAMQMRIIFIFSGLLLLALLSLALRDLHNILGSSVRTLHEGIARLGRGDFSVPIPVPAGMENSVLAWLAETQTKLAKIDAQHKDAEARNQRLTQLYAALSQCNQAIVRCRSESELFAQICQVIVTFGGMQLAWVGMRQEESAQIKPVAAFGNGMDYLKDINVSADPSTENGRGPTGTAFREGQPYWCQNFQEATITAPWHERAMKYGWNASASLPLYREGEVIGVLTMYAAEINAFDAEVQKLLLEMTTDIDFALKNLAHKKQRNLAEAALRESEQHLRTIIETEPECIKVLDAQGKVIQMNAAGLTMLEADSLEQLQEKNLLDYVLPAYRSAFIALNEQVLAGESGRLTFEIKGLKGTHRWLETHVAPMRDANNRVSMLLGITRDITEQKLAQDHIQYLAQFDALTGLPNRTQLDDRAKFAISLAQRSQTPISLMCLDLDHFKDINDTLGHSIGDTLLVQLAQRLRSVLRAEDTVSRLGGDEFIFLLHNVDAHGASLIAQKILTGITAPYHIEPYDLNVTGSIGIALYPDDGNDLETLLKRADAAMYRAKQSGRDAYCFYTAEMQAHSARHLQLVNALRQALDRQQFGVHYQPQIDTYSEQVIGAEALLRWSHPELGTISPAEFIPAAEDCGLILPIGEWVLRQSVRQAKDWINKGMKPMVMAVNLSAIQFRHPDLPALVSRILEEEGLPPEYLELELTEGVTMQDPQSAIATMNDLHDRGIRMSIDDFGTGYSSLSYLKKFKVYKLKIDQSFVRDISTDPEDKAIVGAVIQMAQRLGLLTIAEGVETTGQLAFLREQGCDEIQGYFYSKPLSAAAFEQFVAEHLQKGSLL